MTVREIRLATVPSLPQMTGNAGSNQTGETSHGGELGRQFAPVN